LFCAAFCAKLDAIFIFGAAVSALHSHFSSVSKFYVQPKGKEQPDKKSLSRAPHFPLLNKPLSIITYILGLRNRNDKYFLSNLPLSSAIIRWIGGIAMYEKFVRDRITQLRLQKGVSEYQMSYDIGHSRGYIYNISSGKSLPPMGEFFAICDYFGITPQEFFDDRLRNPELIQKAVDGLKTLDDSDMLLILNHINRLQKTP